MTKVSILTSSFGTPDAKSLELCREAGFEVKLNPHGRRLNSLEVVELASNANGIISGVEILNEETLKQLKSLKVISRCGSGVDNIDLKTASSLGIKVFNTPEAPVQAVAELTLGMMLAMLRNISLIDRRLHEGKWERKIGGLLAGKKVGLVGFGRIGQKVAELLAPFQAALAYTDLKPLQHSKIPFMPFKEILAWGDIISLHCNAPEGQTAALIGAKELELMKSGAFLVNPSRGNLIEERALYQSLKTGHIAGAALDVYAQEPYQGPLKELDQVILTPHIGSFTRETRVIMEVESVNNLIKGLKESHG